METPCLRRWPRDSPCGWPVGFAMGGRIASPWVAARGAWDQRLPGMVGRLRLAAHAPGTPSWGCGPRNRPLGDPEPRLGAVGTRLVRRVGGAGRETAPLATQNPDSALSALAWCAELGVRAAKPSLWRLGTPIRGCQYVLGAPSWGCGLRNRPLGDPDPRLGAASTCSAAGGRQSCLRRESSRQRAGSPNGRRREIRMATHRDLQVAIDSAHGVAAGHVPTTDAVGGVSSGPLVAAAPVEPIRRRRSSCLEMLTLS
jgi:hypothetical protein